MQFIHNDLGHRSGGEIVEVTLSAQANVRLMDSGNFNAYRSGRQHQFYGGLAKRSPTRVTIPRAGHWHVAIDLGGHAGRVNASVRVLPGLLRPITEAPLSDAPGLVREDPPAADPITGEIYDVFISHASEDKDDVVRPLAEALKAEGLKVWYDEFELKIGDSLRRKIDKGVASSRFGVVVLSKAFFGKGWANYELDGLVTRSVSEEQILLPIWHNVSKNEVISYSASLADKLARTTATHTVTEIAKEIAGVVSDS
jgi:hypothetical protein